MKNNSSATSTVLPKRLHVVGICGVATSALAVAFHDQGTIVTGSDKGFFPPVSTELERHGISFYAGWHPEKMIENGKPDVIIVGTASGSHNPETAYAKEHDIPMYSFAEAIGKFFAKEKSICCVGTWGKTSSSALLSYILTEAGLAPSYMFGGVSLSHDSSARLTETKWSVFEGDEYKSSPTDPTAKFFYYKPSHLLLTAVSWDHADLYPTEEEYFNAFRKLLPKISSEGFVVACADQEGVGKVLDSFNGKLITYGRAKPNSMSPASPKLQMTSHLDYGFKNVRQDKGGLSLTISHNGQDYEIRSPMLGLFQSENITGCFAMAHSLGIKHTDIISSISSFKGLKRRMEKRYEGDITVIDDIAHSPDKSRSVLSTLKSIYEGKVICVFEPNSGGRSRESAGKYDDAFKDADLVIIPRLTKLKVAENESEQPMEGKELADTIAETHSNVKYIEDDNELVNFLLKETTKGDVIAFLGSHGFRGMIEEVMEKMNL